MSSWKTRRLETLTPSASWRRRADALLLSQFSVVRIRMVALQMYLVGWGALPAHREEAKRFGLVLAALTPGARV